MIDTLTSLRLIFALMVFVSHCEMLSPDFNIPIFTEGFVGVEFFFVLSGFVMSYGYDERFRRGEVSNKNFWVARAARIYPLHWLTLFVVIVLNSYALGSSIKNELGPFISNLFLCQAYIPRSDYFYSFNSPSWSLCCEQLFYICFPFLVPLLRHPRRLYSLFLLCAAGVMVGMWITPPDLEKGLWYVNPLTRFPDFLLGMIVYLCYRRLSPIFCNSRCATWAELLSILVFSGFYLLSTKVPLVYRYSCYYWLPIAGIILMFSLQKGFFSRLLSCRLLVFGGEISFGFYMIHLLLFRIFGGLARALSFTVPPNLSVLLILITTFALSAISYRYFEKPVNRIIKKYIHFCK